MEQEPNKLEITLREKISNIFKEPLFRRIKKEQEFRSYVKQLKNELEKSKSKDELEEISEYCKTLRRTFYNKNYQYIPLNLD